jgi:hypothetical protein
MLVLDPRLVKSEFLELKTAKGAKNAKSLVPTLIAPQGAMRMSWASDLAEIYSYP